MKKENGYHYCNSCEALLLDYTTVDPIYYEDRLEQRELCENCFEKEATDDEKKLNLITEFEIKEWTSGTFGDLSLERLKDILIKWRISS